MLLFLATIENEHSRRKLEALYIKYKKDMFKVAYRILNDDYLAQDAVHSAFINLIGSLDKIDEINCNKTRAYLVIIVRNIAIDLYRKRKKQSNIALDKIEDFLPDNSKPIDEKIIDAEIFSRVSSKMQELHPAYADIISFKYFYHYSNSEIAKLLNTSPENVRVKLHRARKSLLKLLSQDEELNKK